MRDRINRQNLNKLPNTPASASKCWLWDTEIPGFGAYKNSKGRTSLVFQYRMPGQREIRSKLLGYLGEITLEQGRSFAAELAFKRRQGIDPVLEAKLAADAAKARDELVLSTYAEAYLQRRIDQGKPLNKAQTGIIRRDVIGMLGNKRMDELSFKDVDDFGVALANRATSARRMGLTYLKVILNDAKKRGYITKALTDVIQIPKAGVRKTRLRDKELKRFMEAARDLGDARGDILEVLVRTAKRKDEIRCMVWEELDVAKGQWTLGGLRTKTRNHHVIYAREILTTIDPSINFPWTFRSLRSSIFEYLIEADVPYGIVEALGGLPTGRSDIGGGAANNEDDDLSTGDAGSASPVQTAFEFDEFSRAIMAKIVKKCGRRDYWEDWATDVARIAQTHISRIKGLIDKPHSPERQAFERFLAEIRDDLNDSITEDEAVEMLAQHIITRPVFDALFEGYSFADANPVSRAMQVVLDALHEHNLEKESESLGKFYDSVRRRAAGIDNADAKQKIIVELYDKFFSNAFPAMTKRLGIVYTPVEVVDFIIHSVNDVLQAEFGQTLGSRGVHILDPFTGTGTFITRLLQSGLITPEELAHKYAHEIHANEIVLLAYYIAAINVEAVYHSLSGGDYQPFEGICLTDTFQLYEQERDLISDLMAENSNRRTRQKQLPIRVIMGNPPYSDGQDSANDNAANVSYPKLDESIRATYAERSDAQNKNGLYNSYIRAFRWASDRIGESGVVAYVTAGGWIDRGLFDGMRRCIADEFANIYVFHLRGNARSSGERRRREKDNVFGVGTRTPVAITLLVKNPAAAEHGRIFFHDIGDYLTKEEKLSIVADFGSVAGITAANSWTTIQPDNHGDWVNHRDVSFSDLFPIGAKKKEPGPRLFANYSNGVKTQRDAWCLNADKDELVRNVQRTIDFHNAEVARFETQYAGSTAKERKAAVDGFVEADPRKISWTESLKKKVAQGQTLTFDEHAITANINRPFSRQLLYYGRDLNERVYRMPCIFPDAASENLVICVSGVGDKVPFSALMVDAVPSLHMVDVAGSQCFPRYLYDVASGGDDDDAEEAAQTAMELEPASPETSPKKLDAITEEGLAHFEAAYPGQAITKDDLFYYTYAILQANRQAGASTPVT